MRVAVVTVSTSRAGGHGSAMRAAIGSSSSRAAFGGEIVAREMITDERELIEARLRHLSDVVNCALVLTTGGTGVAPRDVTPEATRAVIEREVPGIAEAMRDASRAAHQALAALARRCRDPRQHADHQLPRLTARDRAGRGGDRRRAAACARADRRHPERALMSVVGEQLAVGLRWLAQQRRVVCALLIDAEGSSPFEPGAFMLIDGDGAIEGSITGGCVESDVVVNALEMLGGDGGPRTLRYGVSDEAAHEVGLMCGGTVHVFVHELAGRRAAVCAEAFEAARRRTRWSGSRR